MKTILKKSLVLLLAVIITFTSATNFVAYAATTGSESSPYSLSLGTSKTVTIPAKSTLWFEFRAKGAINITVKGKSSDITVYEKTLFSKEKIGNTLTTSSFNKIYQLYNSTKYLISVNNWSSSSYNITVKAAYNLQKTPNARGGTWSPDSDSAVPYNIICLGKYYIPKESVAELYQAMNEDAYLGVVDTVIGMSLSAALTYIEPKLGISTLTASMIFSAATSPFSFSLVDMSLNSIKQYGGYDSSTNKYTKGICYSVYLTVDGYKSYTYSSWTDGIMYGEEGYTGRFVHN